MRHLALSVQPADRHRAHTPVDNGAGTIPSRIPPLFGIHQLCTFCRSTPMTVKHRIMVGACEWDNMERNGNVAGLQDVVDAADVREVNGDVAGESDDVSG